MHNNHNKQNKKNQRGFTLMEIIIVLAIFTVATVFLVDIFLTSQKVQKRVITIQKVQSDARFAMEAMSREARMDYIDYDYYTEGISPSGMPELALVDIDENKIVFKKSNKNCPKGVKSCLVVKLVNKDDPSNPKVGSITPKGIEVLDLKFYITPQDDPFLLGHETGEYKSNIQPRVTIVMSTEGKSKKAEERARTYLQTTVSSRIYQR